MPIQPALFQLNHYGCQIKTYQGVVAGLAIPALRQYQALALYYSSFQIQLWEVVFQGKVQWGQIDHARMPRTPNYAAAALRGRTGAQRQQPAAGQLAEHFEIRFDGLERSSLNRP